MKEIKDYVIKLGGKVSILQPLEMGNNYKLVLNGAVTSETRIDNNDGSENIIYKFEPITVELLDSLGKRLALADTRSKSAILRACFWKDWQKTGGNLSFEDWRDKLMDNLILHHTELAEMYSSEYHK
mgnify:CR=1 FL=1